MALCGLWGLQLETEKELSCSSLLREGDALRRYAAFGRRWPPTTNLMRVPVGTGRMLGLV